MQFGLFSGALTPRAASAERCAAAYRHSARLHQEVEAMGYRSSFFTEHHFTGMGQLSATLTLLAWLAARTTQLRLGTAVLVLPWHNPVLLAEQAATVDLLSEGRLDLGVGKGYRHSEYAGFGLDPAEGEARFAECLDVLTRALASNEPFSHAGRFWRFDEIVAEPAPFQRPSPPIWMAASSPSSIGEAARRGFNLMLDQFASPEQLGQRIALYRQGLEAAGHPFHSGRVAVGRNLYVARDGAEKAKAIEAQAGDHGRLIALSRGDRSRPGAHILGYSDAPGAYEAHSLIGEAGEIREGLAALREQGVDYVLLNGRGSVETYRRFAEEIMPHFAA